MQYLKYTINAIPPSNNQFIGRNVRWKYQSIKKQWADMIYLLCRPKPLQPFKRATVVLTYYFPDNRRRDCDNYSGKMILDGLVKAGIIEDDSFKHINLILKAHFKCEEAKTKIEVTEIE